RLLGADAGQRERGHDVHVRRERAAGVGRGPLEDQRLTRDRVEIDPLLRDPRRTREPARRLAALHHDRRDRADPRAFDAVEAGDGARGDEDATTVGRREVHPVLAAEESTTRENDEVAARLERFGGYLLEVFLRRRLDDDARGLDEVVEREERGGRAQALEEALGLLAVARGRADEPEARKALVEGEADLPTDGAEAGDAHVHAARMVACGQALE